MSTTQTELPPSLLTIPQELTEHVLKFCHPRDIARCAAACRPLHDIVYNANDQMLWRESLLSYPFDDPRKALGCPPSSSAEIDWRSEVQQRVEAENILRTRFDSPILGVTVLDHGEETVDLGDEEEDRPLRRALDTVISAIGSAPPGSTGSSFNLEWAESVLLKSPVFMFLTETPYPWLPRDMDNPDCTRQLFARLQSCLALSHEDGRTTASNKRLALLRSVSRCFVYDLRKYRQETYWGPYLLDGNRRLKVNWDHVRHIQNIVLLNLRDFPTSWKRVWPQWGIQSVRPYSAPGMDKRKPWDWAGVEGKWRRVVCFMDYRDLFTFNSHFIQWQFSSLNSGPLNPNFFDDDFTEAVRLMEVDLHVVDPADSSSPVSSPSPSSSASSTPSLFAPDSSDSDNWDPSYPVIHFYGSSQGVHSGASKIKGTVRMMREGTVRWNFVTSYDDTTNRWSAEAVQVGNVGSAMGISGIWTVAVHEEVGDPAGPFWMWKAPEALPKDLEHIMF